MKRRSVIGEVGRVLFELDAMVPADDEARQEIERWRKRERTKAAAWLVNHHRRKMREQGGVQFYLPRGATWPKWFEWALVELKARPASWLVEEETLRDDGGRAVKVWWRRKR